MPIANATEEEKPKPAYSSKELDELVTVLTRMVYLNGIKPDDWTEQNKDIICTWFLDTSHIILVVYFSPKNQLIVSLTYPTEPVLEIVYFLREPNYIFSIDNFHDGVTFGHIDDDVDGTLLLLMENLYIPMFFQKTDWSETHRSQFLDSIHTFLSCLTSWHYKLSGLTVLYVPSEVLIDGTAKILTKNGFIKRLESIAKHWIYQLRLCICDSEQMVPYDLLCPSDECEFWIYRCMSNDNSIKFRMELKSFHFCLGEILLAIKYQMNHKDFLKVFSILQSAQSIFVAPINEISIRIDKEIERAQDNVKYLKLLTECCNGLWSTETPADIPMKLPRILNVIRFIWLNSNHMKGSDPITKLLRYVGNQIIHFCCSKIEVGAIFGGDVKNQIKIANMSIDCCIYYKVMYEKIASHANWPPLVRHLIFNHLDLFINRVYDFIEICENIIIFSRRIATDNQPHLQFGGDHGAEFESICQNIEGHFSKAIAKIKKNSHGIFNINDKTWHKSMKEFHEITTHLEENVDNLMINVFTCIENMDDGLYALACFQRFATRVKLYKTFECKVLNFWNLFADEISMADVELGNDMAEHLSVLPSVSDRVIQLKVNQRRLEHLHMLFDQNKWLPESIDSEKILANYKTLVCAMDKTVQTRFDDWAQSIGIDIVTTLNRLLLKRSLTHFGLFECNIDDSIFTVFRETRLLRWLGFPFPVHVSQFFGRERSICSTYNAIMEMITSYNRILERLSVAERLLLKPIIKLSDKTIAPGSLRLIWINEGLDSYIGECNKSIQILHECIRIYEQTNAKIVTNCERMCEIAVVEIPNDKPRQLREIEILVAAHMDRQTKAIQTEFESICKLILIIRDQVEHIDNVSQYDRKISRTKINDEIAYESLIFV